MDVLEPSHYAIFVLTP